MTMTPTGSFSPDPISGSWIDLGKAAQTALDKAVPGAGVPRLGVVTAVGYNQQPPTVTVEGRIMRFLAGIKPQLAPGDTALWIQNGASPFVIGRMAGQTNGAALAFQTPTLAGTWVNFGSGFGNARYWKDPEGWVYLSGVVKSGTLNSTIFTLPAGYRPDRTIYATALCGGTATGARITITTGGVVSSPIQDTGATNVFMSLDGIRFQEASVRREENLEYLGFREGWIPGEFLDASLIPALYARDDGFCQAMGLITAGTNGLGGCDLPFECRSRWKEVFMTPGWTGSAYQTCRVDLFRATLQPQFGANNEEHLGPCYWWSRLAETRWTVPTLGNSWTRYDLAFSEPGYIIDKYGVVYLRGLMKSGTNNTTVFTLPAGFRPSGELVFPTIANNATGRVDVFANGDVKVVSGANNYVSLAPVMFRAEQ